MENNDREISSLDLLHFRSNEYDWYPLDIAIMLNNIPMIRLLLHYGADESSKGRFEKENFLLLFVCEVQPEEIRYRSVCQQLSDLHAHFPEQSLTNKSTLDEIQVRMCAEEYSINLLLL